jgi:uncharacterized protein (TIGR03083 family)
VTDVPVADEFAGEWPDLRPFLRRELEAYLQGVQVLDQSLPTRCTAWTVDGVTKHLAATFERFCHMLGQGRRGDFTPPFSPEEMHAENERRVLEFAGEPYAALREWGERFLDLANDPNEVMPHQDGTIPVGVQQSFGLMDLAMHHDDCAAAAGGRYVPQNDIVDHFYAFYDRVGGWEETDWHDGTWDGLVHDSGRR